ncbi:MAG: GspE/PulE family protein [Paracoccaceae bacterium]
MGQALIAAGKLDAAGLERAERFVNGARQTLPTTLTRLGLVGERDLAEALASALDLVLVGEDDLPATALHLDGVSPKFLREHRLLPLERTARGIAVAVADPLDAYALGAFEIAAGRGAIPRVGEAGVVERAIERLYAGHLGEETDALATLETAAGEDVDVERLRDQASEAPVVRLVNALIARAVETRASDIHIEPFERRFQVRLRVDGVLQAGEIIAESLSAAVVSRIKIMARLDIAERRLPQDGRIKTVVRGRAVDLRVATLPILHGEAVVIRVLDRESVALDFERLGIREPARGAIERIVAEPHGIFLVTGPTGSGKTTTLYAALNSIVSVERKVLTVEDPVEYQLDGVNQVQVRPSIGLDFASVLRSMLRADPDVIMVGEIRDGETARIAAQAALTGHLVLSTLHTNAAASSVTRLLDMGLEPYLLTSTVSGAAAQRLVRRLCTDCRVPFRAPDELVAELGLARRRDGPVTLYRAGGCPRCGGRGYHGRVAILEVMTLSERLRRLVLARVEAASLRAAAVEEGMRTLFEDGLASALDGVTTLEEVLRVARGG